MKKELSNSKKFPLTARLIADLAVAKGIDASSRGAAVKLARFADASRNITSQWIKGEKLPGARSMRNLVLGLGYDTSIADEVLNFITLERYYPEEAPAAFESLIRVVEEMGKLRDVHRRPPGECRPIPVLTYKTLRAALEQRRDRSDFSFLRKNITRFERAAPKDHQAFLT